MTKVGLALSGGGTRGFAHLGVLKALEEFGVRIDEIAGTSAGSIAAAFYAHGYTPEEILEILTNTNLLKLIWPAFSVKGLLTIEKSEAIYLKFFPHDNFEKTQIPLHVIATNVNKGEAEDFQSGSLSKAIMASCCIPFLFDPVKIGESYYLDGGILNNLPAESLRNNCDLVVGANAIPVVPTEKLGNPKKMIERVSMLALSSNTIQSKEMCDIYLEMKGLRKYGTFDFKLSKEIFQLGYDYTSYYLDSSRNDEVVQKLLY